MDNEQLYFPKNTINYIKDKDLIVQSNQMTLARYNLNVIEKRILYIMMSKIRKKYIEKKDENNITEDLWGNMIINFTPAELNEIENLTRIYPTLVDFKSKTIQINNEDEWVTVGLINYAKHKKKDNIYEIEVSKEIMPFLLELSEKFTAFSLSVAISFSSKYSQRFYELCQMWKNKGYFFYTVAELQDMMYADADKEKGSSMAKEKPFAELKRDVIEVARKELYESFNNATVPASDIYFTYDVKSKTGARNNKVNELAFYIHGKDEKMTNWQLADFLYNIRQLLRPYFDSDKNFVNRILEQITTIELANVVWEKLNDKKQYYSETKDDIELTKIFRTILKQDFDLK